MILKNLIILLTSMTMVFSFNVSYKFVFSKLVVDIDGPWKGYTVSIDSTTMTVGNHFEYPWSRGKVGTMIVKPVESNEEKRIFIDATHDYPPKISIDLSKILGFGAYEFEINLIDDWDTPDRIDVFYRLDSITSGSGTLVKIDTFFLEDGKHTLEISAIDSYGNREDEVLDFKVDVTPPDPPKYEFRNPDLVKFDGKPTIEILENDFRKVLKDVDFIKREKPLLIRKLDDAKNESEFVVIPPVPGTLSLPSAKGPIASIRENLLLMGPQSYTIIGKVLVPEGRSLVLGENSSLVISPTGELFVKGMLMNVSKSTRISGGGRIRVSENGEVFFDSVNLESRMIVESGKIVHLKNMNIKELEVSNVDFLILEKVKLESLKLDHCLTVSIQDSTVSRISGKSVRDLEIWGGNFDIVEVSNFSMLTARDSKIGSFIIDTFSRMDCFNCELGSLSVALGSFARLRSSKVEKVSIRDFSTLDLFKSAVENLNEGENCEVRSEKSEVSEIE